MSNKLVKKSNLGDLSYSDLGLDVSFQILEAPYLEDGTKMLFKIDDVENFCAYNLNDFADFGSILLLRQNDTFFFACIDKAKNDIAYINEKTHRLAPESRRGICCYDAFFHRDKPCERCPVRECAGKGSSAMEIYNPVLKVWTLADSSRIRWGDRDAFLLACHDISPYKVGEAVEGVTLLNLEDR